EGGDHRAGTPPFRTGSDASPSVHQPGIRRNSARGRWRSTTITHRRGGGAQTTSAPFSSPRTMTCATSSAVVAMGAGLIPAVIRVRTKPGRTISTLAPEPTSELASPWAKASRPALDEPYTKLARRVRSPATED